MFNTVGNTNTNMVTSNIIGVQFGMFDPKKIRRGSVCEVSIPDTYDNNIPKVNGLMDSRMGVIDISIKCHTCEQNSNNCIGHFGHVELALPVFHIQYMNIILKLLRCICFRCSNLLIDKSDIKLMSKIRNLNKMSRFQYVYNLCNNSNQSNKIKHCLHNDGCSVMQPKKYVKLTLDKIKEKDGIVKICAEFPSEAFNDATVNRKQYFSPDICLNIFSKLDPEDIELLGFSVEDSHPAWMICTVLAIPPPSVRPSISQDQIQRSEDDLTSKLAEIIKSNNALKQKIEANVPLKTIEDHRTWVQYHVATLIDNEILGKNLQAVRRSMRPLKVLKQRLSGKEGRLRQNLMGKRVDYSGRTVISVDPNISIDEFGVPLSICMNLTFPEVVSPYNIEDMNRLVRNGPNIYPGAKSINKVQYNELGNVTGYRSYKLQYTDNNNNSKISTELELGDIVQRHLVDGDIALFNRQPSLHKMSMMAHKIKVLKKGSTFRLNVYVCEPYNADFDGDEMNMHIPQSIQTAHELLSIASVPTQIISPQGKPIISIVQDTNIAAYLLTQSNMTVSGYDTMNLLATLTDYDGNIVKTGQKYSGRDIYSKILPNMNLIDGNMSYDDESPDSPEYTDNMVIIKNGQLLQGVLDKKLLGATKHGIIHNIYNMHGMKVCMDYLNNHQRLITRWMSSHSFTIGIGNAMISPDISDKKNEYIRDGIVEVNNLLMQVESGTYKSNLNKMQIMESLEIDIMIALNKGSDEAGKLVNNEFSKNNRLYQIVASGSKGSFVNIMQIIACLGQQDMESKRVPFKFSNRTLPHFHINDYSPESRGYVKHSFMEGVTPQEYFFHSMSGRNGVIDTAIRTAESGYTSRKLMKAMEDIKVNYDWTVRNASKKIIQFRYGDDSMDTSKLENVKFIILSMDNVKLDNVYKYDNLDDKNYWNYILVNKVVNELFSAKEYRHKLQEEYDSIYNSRELLRNYYYKHITIINVSVLSPINFYRLIQDVMYKFNIQTYDKSDLNPLYIIEKTEETLAELGRFKNITMTLFNIVFRSHLASKRCITEYRLSKVAFDYTLEIIKYKFFKSLVTHGELVGPVAAQTLGEISTQLTLNSLEWNERIIIYKNGHINAYPIGKFIDNIIKQTDIRNIQCYENDTKYVSLHIKDDYRIQSVDEDGNVSWKVIEAITRHPPINEDGTNTLVKVSTKSGRTVIATKAKSFLTKIGNKILPIRGDELCIGDKVPIMLETPMNDITNIHTCTLYSRTIVLTNDFAVFMAKVINNGEIVYDITGYKSNDDDLRPNTCIIHSVSQKIYELLCKFCDSNGFRSSYNFQTCVYTIYSIEIVRWLQTDLGMIVYNGEVETWGVSKIPEWMIFASMDFLCQFLQTYFDETCYIDTIKNNISCVCISDEMCDTMINIIGRFGIKVSKNIVVEHIGLKYMCDSNIGYSQLVFEGSNVFDFNIIIGLTDQYKKLKLVQIMKNIISCGKCMNCDTCDDCFELEFVIKCECDGEILRNVYFDEIISIEDYESKYEYVYDFTVADTKNFIIHNGLAVRDTFHTAGTGLSNIGTGRLKEIIGVSSNIQVSISYLFLHDIYTADIIYAKKLVSELIYTKLEDIVTKSQILYELPDTASLVSEDIEFINTYHKFNDILDVDMCDPENISPWVLRFEFDKDVMIHKNIYISDIQEIILSNCVPSSNEKIQCVFNDDNASNLVMRIKILYESDTDNYILFLKELEKKILGITLRGIPNLNNAYIDTQNKIKYNVDGSFESIKEYIVQADSSDLLSIIANDVNGYIDCTRISSNDICLVLEIFGIEAVRNLIIDEIAIVLAKLGKSSKHVILLADLMTYQGDLLKISRHGVNKSEDNGPLHKCSFEETPDILSKAAVFSELDDLQGVSANIIMGQFVKAGSNNFDILLDEDKLLHNTITMDNTTTEYNLDDITHTIDEMYQNNVKTNISYDFDNNYDLNINRQYTLGIINMDSIQGITVK
jgi:DNA-directed RNA polymerase beta' subunit